MKKALLFTLLVPRNLCVLILRGYRVAISPLYGEVCRYYPSCSAYALGSIQRFGVIRGTVMGVARILRCHPWAAGGVDDVPTRERERYSITQFGFVIAQTNGPRTIVSSHVAARGVMSLSHGES